METSAPGTVLVQKCTAQPQSTPVVRRVTEQGDLFEHTDQEARVEGGRVVVERVEAAWRKKVRIPPEGLERIRAALRATGFFDLPPDHHPTGTVSDGGETTWTARLDGKEHVVTLHGTPFTSVDAITRLDEELEDVISDAIDESAG